MGNNLEVQTQEKAMQGRDCSLFEQVDQELICAICTCVPLEPKEIASCGHMFCSDCIKTWLQKSNTCCICRNPVSPSDLKDPALALRNILKKITAFCDFKENGCQWKGEWGSLPSHLKTSCEFVEISCSNLYCNHKAKRSEMETHQKECQFRNQKCEFCEENYQAVDFPMHYETCQMYEVECSECGSKMSRHTLENHSRKICPEALLECPLSDYGCTEKYKRKEMDSHISPEQSKHLFLVLRKEREMRMELDNRLNEEIKARMKLESTLLTLAKRLQATESELKNCVKYSK